MLAEEFLRKDIKYQIKNNMRNVEYMRGFIFACYQLDAIKSDTFIELKSYLKEKGGKV